MSSIFQVDDPWVGASENIRKCLSHVKQSLPHLVKLREAAEILKLKYQYPAWDKDAWAHIKFPSKKVAVIVVSTRDSVRDAGLKATWERIGWRCAIVRKQDLLGPTAEALARDLSAALGEIGKK